MGGFGSGRHWSRDDRKGNTGEYLNLDSFYFVNYIQNMRQKNKESLKSSVRWSDGNQISVILFQNHLNIEYVSGSETEREHVRDTLYFSTVTNNYGGQDRIYFTCLQCERRSRFLYLHKRRFKCRKCAGLNYVSQQLTKNERLAAWRLMVFIQEKFKDTSNLSRENEIEYIPPRPKGMHTKTYEKLLMELFELQKGYAKKRIEKVQRQRASMMAAIEDAKICMKRCDDLLAKQSTDAYTTD